MKWIIFVWVAFQYKPVVFVFDTFEACNQVEQSFIRLANIYGKPGPQWIYENRHWDMLYFILCKEYQENEI